MTQDTNPEPDLTSQFRELGDNLNYEDRLAK